MTGPRVEPGRIGAPDVSEYAPFYATYIARVTEEPLVALQRQGAATAAALRRIPESSAGHRYAEGKWTVRDIAGHLADTERIMGYRALRIARGDGTPLPGFDEQAYAALAGADTRRWADLIDDLATVRAASVALFRGLDAAAWQRRGVANGATISVRALAHIIVGHERHHLDILQSRYGLPAS
jgi:DinB superfamily